MHIWVIDDEKALCDIVTRTLEQMGHTVTKFSSQNAATSALDSGRPDGLITDFNLDDAKTCVPIVDMAIAKNVFPLVVMSGDPGNEDNLPHQVRFLAKPINFAELKALFPTA